MDDPEPIFFKNKNPAPENRSPALEDRNYVNGEQPNPHQVAQEPVTASLAGVQPLSSGGSALPISSVPREDGRDQFPSGLIGDVAQFIYDAAHYPNRTIALAGAIAFMAGICGRAYNTPTGAGLNQYIVLVANTGVGKEAVQSAASKLIAAASKTNPTIASVKGPGHIASSAGLQRAIDACPCFTSYQAEIGDRLLELFSPRANPNIRALGAFYLEAYSKSGDGNTLDGSAYSDVSKNVKIQQSPSLTIFGDTTPEKFYAALDEAVIASGFLPRFMVFTTSEPRPNLNLNALASPPPKLVERILTLYAQCETISRVGKAARVLGTPDAFAAAMAFERSTTLALNSTSSEVSKQLHNRSYLIMLKLASLKAVGDNHHVPVITLADIEWAIAIVSGQVAHLLTKFEKNEVGDLTRGEAKQVDLVLHCIGSFMAEPWERYKSYGGTWEMHRDGIITHSHIQRRLITYPAFRDDRTGPSTAITRVVKSLLDGDELREINKQQMSLNHGCSPKAYAVSNPKRFVDAVRSG